MTNAPSGHRERQPAPVPPPPPTRWHQLEITSTSPEGDAVTRRAEGDDAWVAASLRALADQLAPPRTPMRPRGPVAEAAQRDSLMIRRPGAVVLPAPSDVPRANPMSLQ